ncbi:MAG TPA: SDR family oxidoreductase [Bauldia sp.]|nr:SDR family oxidoreductase [Bauldia sp.]
MAESGALSGRVALITGANRGLGAVIAEAYVAAGAAVMLCARDGGALAAVVRDLARKPGAKVLGEPADVTDEAAMQRLVGKAIAAFGKLDILVNNAGVYGPFGVIEEADWNDWKRALEINLYGSIIPAKAVLPHFKEKRRGKIVQLSGGGATNPLPRISAYAASKAAVVRFAETLAEECREFGIDVNSIAPGALNTRLLDEVLEAGPDRVGAAFFQRALKQKEEGGASPALGAELAVFLGSAASDGITGRLISAVWDNWRDLPAHRDELKKTDVFTLRRVAGRDRGLGWADK